MSTHSPHRHANVTHDRSSSGSVQIATVATVVAILVLVAAGCIILKCDVARVLFGPPAVGMTESYAEHPEGATFDHTPFDRVLKKYVNVEGWVDYQGLKGDSGLLDAYIESLAHAPIDQMGRNERLTLLINAYNAFTLRLILDYYPVKSIKDIPGAKRWDAQRWQLGPLKLSLNQIEHEQVRPHFKEPRIHFALVCAAVGCPPLHNEAYTTDLLEVQLDRQARIVHDNDRWFQYDPKDPSTVSLTSLYNWYGGDFEQTAGSVLDYAAQFVPALKQAMDAGKKPKILWLDYDWSLNSRENAP